MIEPGLADGASVQSAGRGPHEFRRRASCQRIASVLPRSAPRPANGGSKQFVGPPRDNRDGVV